MKRIHSTIIFVISLLYLFGCTGSNIDKGNASLKLGDYTMAIEFYETEGIPEEVSEWADFQRRVSHGIPASAYQVG